MKKDRIGGEKEPLIEPQTSAKYNNAKQTTLP